MSEIEENLSRVYTINLGKAWITPQHKRTDRVINLIKEFAKRHMKSEEIKIDQDLNRQIWRRGKTNPPRKVRVKMVKDEDGIVIVSSYEEAIKNEFSAGSNKSDSADEHVKSKDSEPVENTVD
jgi:large subunit ribosomal protein L31e